MTRKSPKIDKIALPVDLGELERRLDYTFNDRTILAQALIHRSCLNEPLRAKKTFQLWTKAEFNQPLSNERLEFLGDAVLNFVSANFLYERFPDIPEGELTVLRAALVRMETLELWARRHDLGVFLLLSTGEERSGGRQRGTILGRAFEAIIGAIFRDGGIEPARLFLTRLLAVEISAVLAEQRHLDDKTILQEAAQAHFHITPSYHTVATTGADATRTFAVEVRLGERIVGYGKGRTKQEAAMQAAGAALAELKITAPFNAQIPPEKAILTEQLS